jgi:REP element-mobilizing transposase RayT
LLCRHAEPCAFNIGNHEEQRTRKVRFYSHLRRKSHERFAATQTNRLHGYDYSQNGAYFITICAKNRAELFGRIAVGDGLARPETVELFQCGQKAKTEIENLSLRYESVLVDRFVIMPNHIHAIIVINAGYAGRASPSPTLGNVVGGYKSGVSRLCGFGVWQRFFYDHIIRNQDNYNRIAEYIQNNPIEWKNDFFYVEAAFCHPQNGTMTADAHGVP